MQVVDRQVCIAPASPCAFLFWIVSPPSSKDLHANKFELFLLTHDQATGQS
jgi:hypothetical protein